jgi:hypothetical protein
MKNLLPTTNKYQELALSKLNSEEQKIVKYSQSSLCFKDYDNTNKQDLAKTLVQLSYFVGIKEPVSIESLKLIVNFLCSQFPHFNKDELIEAFNLSCSGKLGDFEHFQNFSPIYIGKIINSYLAYSIDAKRKYNQSISQLRRDEESLEKEKEYDKFKGAIQSLVLEYNTYLKSRKKSEDGVIENTYLIDKDFSCKLCYKLLSNIGFFSKEIIEQKNGNALQIMEDYFLDLPNDYNEAIKKIKQDINVCNNGNNTSDNKSRG